MSRLISRFVVLAHDDRGAALAEWGLLVVLIAIVALVGVTIAGDTVSTTYSDISSGLVYAGS